MRPKAIKIYRVRPSGRMEERGHSLEVPLAGDFARYRLALDLFQSQQYSEAAQVASEVVPEPNPLRPNRYSDDRISALKELAAASKRVRPIVEEEARQIPGPNAMQITMDAFDLGIQMYEAEIAKEETSSISQKRATSGEK